MYIVHASLLLIFLGGIVDGVVGYRGFMLLAKGDTSHHYSVQTNTARVTHDLPFAIRCDDARQENYTVGEMARLSDAPPMRAADKSVLNRETNMPKQYWSDLTVLEDGREVLHKRIVVNDPLTYRGVRFYQSSMGQSGKLESVRLLAVTGGKPESAKEIQVSPGHPVALDGGYQVALARFVPDYYTVDNEVFTKSEFPDNPAFQLALTAPDGKETKMWLLPLLLNMTQADTPIRFAAAARETEQGAALDMTLAPYTGLEVSYQPGQWAVWGGVLLMALGLGIVFYLAHTRYWAVVVQDAKLGPAVWVGGTANRNRIRFEQDLADLVELIKAELATGSEKQVETKVLAKA